MYITDNIQQIISEKFNSKIEKAELIGKGASGQVYRIKLNSEPFMVAVKLSKHYDLIKEEKDMLDFLGPRVSYNVPKTYFLEEYDGIAILAMEYIKGISGSSKKLLLMPKKTHLAENIINALIKTQSCSYDKFGSYKNPEYNTWEEYYSDFFSEIYTFSKEKHNNNELSNTVMNALELTQNNFNKIFSEKTEKSYLCHGDFWMCNMLIDFKKGELSGVIDPFNVIWAEPEYELFALTLGFGKTLRLYDLYKSKCVTSKYCDLKVELYALCNELHWYQKLGSIGHDYLEYRANRLIKHFETIQ